MRGRTTKEHDHGRHNAAINTPTLATDNEEVIVLPEELTPAQRQQVQLLVAKYADIMSRSDLDIGHTNLVEHVIDTGDARPIRQPLCRHPEVHQEKIDRQVQELLDHGLIEKAVSPWGANVVLVKKKDKTMRMCVDYRMLKNITRFDTYPLPHMDVCLQTLRGSTWFSTLDLRAGYHNIPIKESDCDKTSFITHQGCWRYRVMPFGLATAPGTFQRLMDLTLSGLTYDICMVYLDDIIVFSNTFEQHLERLELVFDRLRKAKLKLKPSKCNLFN